MALKDITTIEETEQLSADATFYTEDGGLFRRSGVDAVKDALGLALESTATKQALLNCFQHVAWVDENGQEYYDALYDALYNIPVSITATFVQGDAVIYNTDPLSTLRQYLVVRATYEDETVQTVTAYTLSGNLTVGTSTITVAYKGRSATFEVEVTQAESYITAVYTPGTGTVYTDDPLDSLKDNLVVTYYANQDAQGVTVPAGDYTLSGTLQAGTSTIAVDYDGNTTTFSVSDVIDFYNTAVWRMGENMVIVPGTPAYITGSQTQGITLNNASNATPIRRTGCVTRGKAPMVQVVPAGVEYYPVPVPATATQCSFSLLPSTMQCLMQLWKYDSSTNIYTIVALGVWTDTTLTFTPDSDLFFAFNIRHDSSNGTFTDEPTEFTVTFS